LKIEKNIPLPHIRSSVLRDTIAKLDEGESFVVPTNAHRMQCHYAADRLNVRITTAKINGNGYRVWLVSKQK
jgi:hypothetical protein